MKPLDVIYDACRYYIRDFRCVVNPALYAKVEGTLRSRNIAGLAACSRHFDPACHGIDDWRFLRQVEAFFKKNALLSNKDVCREQARISFMENERVCSETNVRLARFIRRPGLLDPARTNELARMESYISRTLGDFQPFLDSLPSLVRVTPGATAHSKRKESLPPLKMKMRLFCTERAGKYIKALYHFYGFRTPRLKFCRSNRVELVPKNWKTDRTIACEPEGNIPLQLAFDKYAKRRLRRVGIDLSNQSVNQCLARRASVDNSLVTVDFSSASDTVAYNAVSLVFPVDWYKFLKDVRTPCYRGVFGEGTYAKFSSMGNGSTFAIETLLFAAACYAVGSKEFSVYGDDVIIEKEFYDAYLSLTGFLGFTINREKSFHDGPFRESCGLDAFNGVDVTPVYVRGLDARKASQCHFINTLASLTYPGSELLAYLVQLVRTWKLPFVPYTESTLAGVWIEPARARSLGVLRRKHGIDMFKSFVPLDERCEFVDSRGYYLWFLYKNSQVLFSAPWEIAARPTCWTRTSSVPVFRHKYVRKRVHWIKPVAAHAYHLNWWSAAVAGA